MHTTHYTVFLVFFFPFSFYSVVLVCVRLLVCNVGAKLAEERVFIDFSYKYTHVFLSSFYNSFIVITIYHYYTTVLLVEQLYKTMKFHTIFLFLLQTVCYLSEYYITFCLSLPMSMSMSCAKKIKPLLSTSFLFDLV